MLRLVPFLTLAATVLCGCSVVPQGAWNFDPTRPLARPAADAAQTASLAKRIAELQAQLDEVRARIAAQPDAPHRLPLYSQEHRIDGELSPLERELSQYAQAH